MAGLPAEEAIEIFNVLTRTLPSDVQQISRWEWRLRTLSRRRPGDLTIRVAHLESLLLLGRASEALETAEKLWPYRQAMGSEQLQTFFSQLFHLGNYDKALSVAEEITRRGEESQVPNWVGAHLQIQWAMGNFKGFCQLLDIIPPEMTKGWTKLRDEIREAGIEPYFLRRQEIVREETFGKQTLQAHLLAPEIEIGIVLAHYVYIDSSYEDRTLLEDRIRDRIERLFREDSQPESLHWELISEVIVPITAAWPRHKDLEVSAA
jgi:hypothetical protein